MQTANGTFLESLAMKMRTSLKVQPYAKFHEKRSRSKR